MQNFRQNSGSPLIKSLGTRQNSDDSVEKKTYLVTFGWSGDRILSGVSASCTFTLTQYLMTRF